MIWDLYYVLKSLSKVFNEKSLLGLFFKIDLTLSSLLPIPDPNNKEGDWREVVTKSSYDVFVNFYLASLKSSGFVPPSSVGIYETLGKVGLYNVSEIKES
jgi:hypothetical protein